MNRSIPRCHVARWQCVPATERKAMSCCVGLLYPIGKFGANIS
jgi:hypothetical protein